MRTPFVSFEISILFVTKIDISIIKIYLYIFILVLSNMNMCRSQDQNHTFEEVPFECPIFGLNGHLSLLGALEIRKRPQRLVVASCAAKTFRP
jgi:hypothetical protein